MIIIIATIAYVYACPRFWRNSRLDGCLWVLTFLAVVLLDVDSGLIVGMALNVLLLIYKSIGVDIVTIGEV